jgi:hypothetical protein
LLGDHHTLIDKDIDGPAHCHGANAVALTKLSFGWKSVARAKDTSCDLPAQDANQLGIGRFVQSAVNGVNWFVRHVSTPVDFSI